jgi:hypothetical protein
MAAGPAKTSAAALSMISGLRPAAAPSPLSRPGGPGKDVSTSNPVVRTGVSVDAVESVVEVTGQRFAAVTVCASAQISIVR